MGIHSSLGTWTRCTWIVACHLSSTPSPAPTHLAATHTIDMQRERQKEKETGEWRRSASPRTRKVPAKYPQSRERDRQKKESR